MTIQYIYSKILKKYLRGRCILRSKIHRTAKVASGCNIVDSTMGRYSYVGYDSELAHCVIGAYCSLANNVVIGGANHPMDWVSTSPVFENVRNSGPTKRFAKLDLPSPRTTYIGNDVWIGNKAIIMQGVKIGDGAIVGAGAVVTKDVAPYSIVAGCPAKLIRYRFDEETISELTALQWWNMSDEELSQLGRYATDVNEFIIAAKKLKR